MSLMAWNFEDRWRYIARYHDERNEVVSVISEVGTYPVIKEKYDQFIKNLAQIGTLVFGKIVAEL